MKDCKQQVLSTEDGKIFVLHISWYINTAAKILFRLHDVLVLHMSLEHGLEVGQAFVISFLQIWFDHNRISQEEGLCRGKASFNKETYHIENLGLASWFYIKCFVHRGFRTSVLPHKSSSLGFAEAVMCWQYL